jgi:hypothetical protein
MAVSTGEAADGLAAPSVRRITWTARIARTARIVVWVQALVCLSYFAGAGLLYARDTSLAADPMTLMPDLGGVELLLYLPVFLAVVLALPVGIALVVAGAAIMPALGRDKRLMWTVGAATAVSAAYLAVSLTGWGASIQQWLLN